ncbi:MAG: N-acyl-D-amino-acid deacylase family protein [Myxococcota bacterium]
MADANRRLIRGGTVYDGTGGDGRALDVLVEDGRVTALLSRSADAPADAEVVDATGCWVTPGFVDLHTHYDAEVEITPALGESLRHGVTTVMLGSCGLSMAVGDPEDLADMFCRVEGIPRSTVKPLLERVKSWADPPAYLDHLGGLALGPNVAAMLGHSTIRAHTMGLGRSVTKGERPTRDELTQMEGLLRESLDAGYLGLSINTLPWDKLDGDQYRSHPTPSVYASWAEYRRLTRILRERGRVFQGVPNVMTKVNTLLFLLEGTGVFRRPLKTTFIALIDAKAARMAFRLVGCLTRMCNALLGGNIRVQALPNEFDLWSDGMEVPVLEEIGAGTEALHLTDEASRAELLRDPAYRKRFKRQWGNEIFGRAYHRDLDEARIMVAPDPALAGRTFGELARERGQDPVDTFLDLMAEHGSALRWHSVVGNDRPEWLRWILTRPDILVGFSDAGAHLRNMAFYNFPLRMLRFVHESEQQGAGFMTVGEAVRRLTSEIADWFGLDAGRITEGGRADLVVIDPAGLDEQLDSIVEMDMPGFDGLRRLVRRNDGAVRAVLVNGRLAYEGGRPRPELGVERGFGSVLRAAG